MRMIGTLAVFVSAAVMPSSAHAEGAGIGQAFGLIGGRVTALVIPPIAGAITSSATSGRVSFWPTTGVSFGSALLLGAAGVGIGTLDRNSNSGVWAPGVGALLGAIVGAGVYGALSDPGVAPQQTVPTVSLPVTPGGGSGTLFWRF